jgi:hypothetical protein
MMIAMGCRLPVVWAYIYALPAACSSSGGRARSLPHDAVAPRRTGCDAGRGGPARPVALRLPDVPDPPPQWPAAPAAVTAAGVPLSLLGGPVLRPAPPPSSR